MGNHLERVIGVLNGVIGDYLKRTDNGLTTAMQLVRDGHPVPVAGAFHAAASARATPRVVVLVHGLMSTEDIWTMPDGETYGSLLSRDLGYMPLYLRYNTGLRVSENGEALDALLEQLVCACPVPVEELVLIGHSMGGLVSRSAVHAASERGRRWLPLLKRAFYLGTPHLGAPLERFGSTVTWALARIDNPYTKLIADIVDLRSGGMKDLGHANLRREDWEGAGADALLQNRRHPVPLLPHIRHHLIAGALTADPWLPLLFGDAMVSLRSATGRAVAGD
jgi:pimeloyl-ACP methyl ester carboxylesterase